MKQIKALSRLTAIAAPKDVKAVLTLVEQAEKKMASVRNAMDDVIALTSKLPGSFKTNIHSGPIHNLDTPKEYPIWVGIENVKGLYSLSKEYKETMQQFQFLRRKLAEYK